MGFKGPQAIWHQQPPRLRPKPVALSALVFLALLASLFLTYGRTSLQDPTSWLFRAKKHETRLYSDKRKAQIYDVVKTMSYLPRQNITFSANKTLCIAIPSMVRTDGSQTLTDTISSLVHNLSRAERGKMEIKVLIAHTDPKVHPLWTSKWLRNLVDEVWTYADVAANTTSVRQMELEDAQHQRKQQLDFSLALTRCSGAVSNAEYVVIMEDDVLARANWFSILIDSLSEAKRRSEKRGDWPFMYLRLFYTERYLGWNREEWPVYLGWSLLIATLFSAVLAYMRRTCLPLNKSSAQYLTGPMCALYILLYTPLLIVSSFALGRMTLFPLRRGLVEMNNFGCCSQGLVFPKENIPYVIHWLHEHTQKFVDQAIEEMADVTGATRWAVVPSLLQHIGSVSSKDFDGFITDWIWNFEFERLGVGE